MTQKQAIKAAAWAKERLGLQSWSIVVTLSDDPPSWADDVGDHTLGLCYQDICEMTSEVWVSPGRCRDNRESETETLFHELAHSMLSNAGMTVDQQANCHFERICNHVAAILDESYMLQTGKS